MITIDSVPIPAAVEVAGPETVEAYLRGEAVTVSADGTETGERVTFDADPARPKAVAAYREQDLKRIAEEKRRLEEAQARGESAEKLPATAEEFTSTMGEAVTRPADAAAAAARRRGRNQE